MRQIVFELCAETIEACLAAREGGADRVELCSALSEGGLTPSHGLVSEAIARAGLPIHVMLRPRGGDFLYRDDDFAVLCRDLTHLRPLGVAGFVLGLLQPDGVVDVERTAKLVAMAAPLEVTFHRAFDQTPNLSAALEDVIRSGCRRVLTSGGEHTVETGIGTLKRLVVQAAGRIEIAVGGGLRLQNAAQLARTTDARHFHGSLRRVVTLTPVYGQPVLIEDADPATLTKTFVDSSDVRAMVETLREASASSNRSRPLEKSN